MFANEATFTPSHAISRDGGAGAAQHPVGSGPPWKGNFPGRSEQAPDSPSHLKEVLCSTNHTLDLDVTQKGLTQVDNQSSQRLYFDGVGFSPYSRFLTARVHPLAGLQTWFTTKYNTNVFSDTQAAVCNKETTSS